MICSRCMLQMPQTDYHSNRDNALRLRMFGRIPIEYALALFKFSKDGPIQKILHSLKYKNAPEVGVMLGKMYAERIMSIGFPFEYIVPVPLHAERLRHRGYNQSAMFALGLSEALRIPYSDELVIRRKATATQTKKSKLDRWKNVTDIFELKAADEILGLNVLLVDDVITTGSTIEACASALLEAGCRSISVACIACA
jgi:ComF family protein